MENSAKLIVDDCGEHIADDEKFFECSNELDQNISRHSAANFVDNEEAEVCNDIQKEAKTLKDLENIRLDKETNEILTEEEKEDLRKDAMKLKENGNAAFKQQKYAEAEMLYTEGLQICPKCFSVERSVLYSNRAACYMNTDKKEEAIKDCTEAIELRCDYLRALQRRALLYETTDKLEEALTDYKRILKLQPDHNQARLACSKLPGQINERNEKLKNEMLGSLKEMGNKLLGNFGLSTDNFQFEQNPQTGAYNIQFKQNPAK